MFLVSTKRNAAPMKNMGQSMTMEKPGMLSLTAPRIENHFSVREVIGPPGNSPSCTVRIRVARKKPLTTPPENPPDRTRLGHNFCQPLTPHGRTLYRPQQKRELSLTGTGARDEVVGQVSGSPDRSLQRQCSDNQHVAPLRRRCLYLRQSRAPSCNCVPS